jgi:hypothetical protein
MAADFSPIISKSCSHVRDFCHKSIYEELINHGLSNSSIIRIGGVGSATPSNNSMTESLKMQQ